MPVSGDLSFTALADIIQLYASRGAVAAIRLRSTRGPKLGGVLYVEGGELVHAEVAEFVGVLAVRQALEMRDGRFSVEPGVRAPQRTIHEPLQNVLLQAQPEEAVLDDAEVVPDPEPELSDPPPEEPMPTPPSRPPSTSRPPQPAPTVPPPLEPTLPPPARGGPGKAVAIAGAAAVLLVVAALVVVFVQRRKAEEEALAAAARAAAPPPAPKELAPITFGMVGPLSGPAKELGRQMRTGVELAFQAANDAGGVEGRKLKLVALDDGYEPARTLPAMKELVEKHHVAGFVGNVGTPTAVVAVPYALEQRKLFFGAFTGAPLLRKDPPDRYVFNYRASYAEETAATVKYLVELRRVRPEQIAVFAQKDSYGDAGFDGVARTLRQVYQRDPQRILRVGYERNTVDVGAAAEELLAQRSVRAVVMVATYRAAAKLIEKLRERGSDLIVTNVSFVGSTALAEELAQLGPKFAAGVVVTQVVPLPDAGATALMRYRDLLAKQGGGERPDFVSLEGYVAGSILAEGLRRAGKDAGTEQVVDALERLRDLDLGFGVSFSFGLSQHQASHKVWGTVLDERGRFLALDLD